MGDGRTSDGAAQLVLTRDQHDPTGPLVRRRITRTYQRTAYALQVLTLRDEDGNEQTLRVTEEHPFYVQHVGWTPAKSLEAGDMLLGADGTLTVVSNEAEQHPGGVTVYNLEVEQAHTYFVLAEDANDAGAVWVHNANGYDWTGSRTLGGPDRPSTKYQRFVTGRNREELWTGPSRPVGVDGTRSRYTIEAKWTGNDLQWSASQYNPRHRHYIGDAKIVSQARELIALNRANAGNGVRYALSNTGGQAHFEALFQQHFGAEMANGFLRVLHVPGRGM